MQNQKLKSFIFSKIGQRLGYLLARTSFLYIVFSLVVYASPALDKWQSLAFAPVQRIAMLTPPFGDLAMLTHTARCEGSLSDLYDGRVKCDHYGRLFTYPPMALWMFSGLGFSANSLGLLGLLLGLAVTVLTGAFFFTVIPSAAVAGPLLSLAYLSLPFQLALERGNNDLIVFLLLALLALALSGEKRSAASAALLAFLAVATKILPLFGLVAAQLLPTVPGSSSRLLLRNLRSALLGGLAGLTLVVPWLSLILRNSPRPSDGLISHGLTTGLSLWSSHGLLHGLLPVVGTVEVKLLFVLAGVVAAWQQGLPGRLRAALTQAAGELDSRRIALTFCLFTGTWVGTYLFTRSYDYKSLFLMPALALAGTMLSTGATGRSQRAGLTLVLLPLLSAWFTPYLAVSFQQPLGDWLEVVNDGVLIPLLTGALVVGLVSCRFFGRSSP